MANLSKIILLQSFRRHDVPVWVNRCQDSVKRCAEERNWTYRFAGDEFFDWAPSWVRKDCGKNVWGLSDICRLEWMKDVLREWDTVIWADIDILVIDPGLISLNLDHSYGFAYELTFGERGWQHGINNAFMFFQKNSDMLQAYLEKCYEVLRAKSGLDGCERTAIGPDLLRVMNIPEGHAVKGLNILNARSLLQMYDTPSRQIPERLSALSKGPFGAVNLCLNERSCFEGKALLEYDHVLDTVSSSLLDNSLTTNQGSMLSASDEGNFRRNQLCPCGSNLRYKHCHGLQG